MLDFLIRFNDGELLVSRGWPLSLSIRGCIHSIHATFGDVHDIEIVKVY